jgi:hypothetical protein
MIKWLKREFFGWWSGFRNGLTPKIPANCVATSTRTTFASVVTVGYVVCATAGTIQTRSCVQNAAKT